MPTPKVATTSTESRRTFLRHTLTAGAGVSVAAMTSGIVLAVTEADADADADATENNAKKGYRLTPHIAAYYQSASS